MNAERKRILIVEDEASIRRLLADLLHSQGFETLEAEDGAEGVQLVFAEAPDLVLTDLRMPVLDGFGFLHKVRSRIPPGRLPVIVLSALSMEDKVVQAFRAGATDYVIKPFKPFELVARVRSALDRKVCADALARAAEEAPEGLPGPPLERDGLLDMGKYRILEEIDAGGMGRIYRALHCGYGVEAAVKVLDPEKAMERRTVLRFLHEIRIASRMDHVGIVRTFDAGIAPGGPYHYYAMELLENRSLAALTEENGPLDETVLVEAAMQTAGALAYMHGMDVVHRDVKPENLLLQGGKRWKLIDFGLAREVDAERLTVKGSLVGTPGFVAPESILGEGAPTPAADVYGLGATLYTAATGEFPFGECEEAMAVLSAQIQKPLAPIRTLNPRISPRFARLIRRMMARDPDERLPDMEAVLAELAALREAG